MAYCGTKTSNNVQIVFCDTQWVMVHRSAHTALFIFNTSASSFHSHTFLPGKEKKNTKSGNSSHWWSKQYSLPVTNSKSNKVLCCNCSYSRWWKTIHRFFDFCNIVVTTRCPWSSTNSPARSLLISQQIHHLLFITGSNFLYHLKRDTCASFTVVLRARVAFTDCPRNHPPL